MGFLKDIYLILLLILSVQSPNLYSADFGSYNSLPDINTDENDVLDISIKNNQASPDGVNQLYQKEPSGDDEFEVDEALGFFLGFDIAEDASQTPSKERSESRIMSELSRSASRSSKVQSRNQKALKDAQANEKAEEVHRKILQEINAMINNIDLSGEISEQGRIFLSTMESLKDDELDVDMLSRVYEEIPAIESFKKVSQLFTLRFPKNLPSYAIRYLNACAKLYPIAKKLNEFVKSNGLKIIINNEEYTIGSFDFYHIFLGDMKYDVDKYTTLSSMKKGGHLYIPSFTPETRLFEKWEIDPISACFYIMIRPLDATFSSDFKTYFPYGMSPEECFEIVLKAIERHNQTDENLAEALDFENYVEDENENDDDDFNLDLENYVVDETIKTSKTKDVELEDDTYTEKISNVNDVELEVDTCTKKISNTKGVKLEGDTFDIMLYLNTNTHVATFFPMIKELSDLSPFYKVGIA